MTPREAEQQRVLARAVQIEKIADWADSHWHVGAQISRNEIELARSDAKDLRSYAATLTPPTPEAWAEVARLCEAATPGPWRLIVTPTACGPLVSVLGDRAFNVTRVYGGNSGSHDEANAAYIVAACNAGPSLVAQLTALTASQADIEKRLRTWTDWNLAERKAGKAPTHLNPWTVLGWMGHNAPESDGDTQIEANTLTQILSLLAENERQAAALTALQGEHNRLKGERLADLRFVVDGLKPIDEAMRSNDPIGAGEAFAELRCAVERSIARLERR